jgi:ABC-2 type transport system ATP-binding protein
LLDQVGLSERGDDRFRAYSTGMKQRLGIAAALLGDPDLLLLDEPTSGLDPVGIAEMRTLLVRLCRRDRAMLVSSHHLAELEQICDWLVIIDEGRLLFQGPTSELLTSAGARLIVAPEHDAELRRLGALISGRGHSVEWRDEHLVVRAENADARRLAAELNVAAMDAGVVLAELRAAGTTLEDRYLAMVSGEKR